MRQGIQPHEEKIGAGMTAQALIQRCIASLQAECLRIAEAGPELSVAASQGRWLRTVGGLHLYEFIVPAGVTLAADTPVAVVPAEETEPTEGIVLHQVGRAVLVQIMDALGDPSPPVTLVQNPDRQLSISAQRLEEMIAKVHAYNLGPAERLTPLFSPGEGGRRELPPTSPVLTMLGLAELELRRQKLAGLALDLIRADRRVLLISPDHQQADEVAGIIARAMKGGGLNCQTWMSRYEMPIRAESRGMSLQELGFEAQVHRFYAQSQAEKASLRQKYERFRELVPLMAHKAQKQKDLDEVRLLEWRLLTQLRDLQAKAADVEATLKEYESLPLVTRLAMQAVGKNRESLQQYRELYHRQIEGISKEIDVASARVRELVPEAAVSRALRQEFDDLKEAVAKLGGTKQIRELLAAEAASNRQAFLQNRRLVIATPARVASDPLFSRVRFDVLIADEAPRIAAAQLVAAAGLVRERIVLSGDPGDMATSDRWDLSTPLMPAAPPAPPAVA